MGLQPTHFKVELKCDTSALDSHPLVLKKTSNKDMDGKSTCIPPADGDNAATDNSSGVEMAAKDDNADCPEKKTAEGHLTVWEIVQQLRASMPEYYDDPEE